MEDRGELGRLGEALAGWDGRRLSKLRVVAIAERLESVRDPVALRFADLWAAPEELRPDRVQRTGDGTNAPTLA